MTAHKLLKLTEATPIAGFFATQIDPTAIVGPAGLILMGVYVSAYLFQVFNKKLLSRSEIPTTIATEVHAIRERVKEIRKEIQEIKEMNNISANRISSIEARMEQMRHTDVLDKMDKEKRDG
jgi:hypothetical protein